MFVMVVVGYLCLRAASGCLDDKREDYLFCAVLCTITVPSHMHTYTS